MFERFTKEARDVVLRVRLEVLEQRASRVGPEHLLLALLSPDSGIAYAVLHEAGIEAEHVRREIARTAQTSGTAGTPLGSLDEGDAAALKSVGIDLDVVLGRITQTFGTDALASAGGAPRRGFRRRRAGSTFSDQAKKVLEMSLREAMGLHNNYIGTEHLLLGLAHDRDGLATKILTDAGLTLDELRRRVLARLSAAA